MTRKTWRAPRQKKTNKTKHKRGAKRTKKKKKKTSLRRCYSTDRCDIHQKPSVSFFLLLGGNPLVNCAKKYKKKRKKKLRRKVFFFSQFPTGHFRSLFESSPNSQKLKKKTKNKKKTSFADWSEPVETETQKKSTVKASKRNQ